MQGAEARRGSIARASAPFGMSGSSLRSDAFLTRVIVMVDEATEPALSETDAAARRAELVAMANSSNSGPGPSAAGANIAYAVRKRLKSDDATAVINTLKLLDELMRTCPYFYRYVADDKMFRRLWRFVVPDYKNGVRSMIPFASKHKTAIDLRGTAGRPEIAVKVLILIRAWAEELSIMYNGKFDPSAGFLIERYNSKRIRIKFPEVPQTDLPWVCPVGPNAAANVSAMYSSTGGAVAGSSSGARTRNGGPVQLPESLGLPEVENTVNLFENMIDNATNVRELRTDVIKDLSMRCRLILENIDRLSLSMNKEEELARAIKVSEKLRRALKAYDTSLQTGEMTKTVPIVEDSALDSEDEGYDIHRMGSSSADYRSRDHSDDEILPRDHSAASSRVPPQLPRPPRSTYRTLDRSRSHDSHLNTSMQNRFENDRDREIGQAPREDELNAREKREAEQRRFHREYVASKGGSKASPAASADRRERSRSPSVRSERKSSADDFRKERSKSKRREEKERDREEAERERDDTPETSRRNAENGKKKHSKRELKKAHSTHVSTAGSSGAKPPRKSKSKGGEDVGSSSHKKIGRSSSALPNAPNALVDLGAPDSQSAESDSSSDGAKKNDTFAMLGERYITSKSKSSSDSSLAQQVVPDTDQALQQLPGNMQSLAVSPQQAMAMYQTAQSGALPPGLPYGSVVMMPGTLGMGNPMGVPNPMAAMGMYGSVNPMLQPNPAAMFSAYNTINPALYYNTVNPLAYASQNPALAMGNAYMQQPQQSQQTQKVQPTQQMQPTQQQPQPQQVLQPQQQQIPANMFAHTASQLPQQSPQLQSTSLGYASPDVSSQPFPPHGQPGLPPFAPLPQTNMRLAQMQQVQPAPPAPAVYTTVTNAPAPPPAAAPPPPQQLEQMNPAAAAYAYQSVNMASGPQFQTPAQQQADQAAAFQATMANAAAVYQAAAAAYQSVQGQSPLQPQVVGVASPPQRAIQMQPQDAAAMQQQQLAQLSQGEVRPAQ